MPRRESRYGATITQALLERGAEQRRRAQKEQDVKEAVKLQKIVYGTGTIEEKREAATRLAALGFSVPADALREKVNLGGLYTALKVPENLRPLFDKAIETNLLTAGQALQMGATIGEQAGTLTDEEIREAHKLGYFKRGVFANSPLSEMTADQIIANTNLLGGLVKEFGSRITEEAFLGGAKTQKATEAQARQQVYIEATTDAEGNPIPLNTLMKDSARLGALQTGAGINPKQLMALYGADASMYDEAEKSIMTELSGGNPIMFAFAMEEFVTGKMVGEKKKKWDQYLTPDGTLKPELVTERMTKIQQAIINQSDLGHIDIENVPIELRSFVTGAIEAGLKSRKQVKAQIDLERSDPTSKMKITKEQELQILEYFPDAD